MNTNPYIEVVFICDNAYVLPTGAAIASVIANKFPDTRLRIHIIAVELTQDNLSVFRRFIRDGVEVAVKQVLLGKVEPLHTIDPKSFCSATSASLFKFYLPEILAGCGRVLYLDGDVIVRGDLAELYGTDLKDCPLGAVVDSGSIYFRHAYVKRVKDYFNAGVMLMDLEKLRRMNAAETLVNEKIASRDSLLMDQNVFNVVFDKQYCLLPIRYNCQYVNLYRARNNVTISQLNERYGTGYHSLEELRDTAEILHYSSKDKPWKAGNTPCGEEWLRYCHYMMDEFDVRLPLSAGYTEKTPEPASETPMVSIITPVYNLEKYIAACVESILAQTFTDFEMICVDDGSADSSLGILLDYANRDLRIRVITQKNQGQSAARNHGAEAARGRYIYYFDGDDMLRPDALKDLVEIAENAVADVVLFDGDAVYETEELKMRFPAFESFYHRRQAYPGITEGGLMFSRMVKNHDHKSSPGLFLIRRDYLREKGIRFREGILHEDNLYALQLVTLAARVIHTPSPFFLRRVRLNSIMTSEKGFKNFLGLFTSAVAILCFIEKKPFPQYVLEAAQQQIRFIISNASEIYRHLDKNERIKPVFMDCNEEIISSLLISMIENACAAEKAVHEKEAIEQQFASAAEETAGEKRVLEQKIAAAAEVLSGERKALEQQFASAAEELSGEKKALEHELAAIRSSGPYRIGQIITWIPRKLRGGIRYSMKHSISQNTK
jgi:lipopolysaccharide biosynthesis glycosyltransferase